MSLNKGLFTSNSSEWGTPQAFFDMLNDEFNFTVDVCATPENAKCEKFYSPEEDGLKQEWRGVCWMNPPYGREIGEWMRKAYESSLKGATVVCLVPARTDTKWWHEYAMKGEIRFVKGRLKFTGKRVVKEKYLDYNDLDENGQPKVKVREYYESSTNSAPFPSAVVVFSKNARVGKLITI